jgi:hypothetical protein
MGTGHPNANWSIEPSALNEPPKSFVIEKLYIEGGLHLIGGFTGSIGIRDKPVHMSKEKGYRELVNWVRSQPILFYDAEDHRAWLIDGASALLHLVRASIHQDRQNAVYRSTWTFDETLEGDGLNRGGPTAAIDTLLSINNLNRPLYLDIRSTANGQVEEVAYYFNNRVQEILYNFQVLIDYQAQVAARDGYWFRYTGKIISRSVIGFDFWDVAKPLAPVRPRAHDLRKVGHGWIDYVRSIRATTLFGRNFGDLLQATSPGDLCPEWRTVPKGFEYLAVSVSTLKIIRDARNEAVLRPGEITDGIMWSSRLELFSRCGCISLLPTSPSKSTNAQHPHHDPVQLLLPQGVKYHFLNIPKIHCNISLGSLSGHGAVLFGHTPYKGMRTQGDDRSRSTHLVVNGMTNSGITLISSPTTTNQSIVTVAGSNATQRTARVMTPTTSIAPSSGSGNDNAVGSGKNGKGGVGFWARLRFLKSSK